MVATQLLVSFIVLGSFFGLIGLSYYLILEGTAFFNFAIGPYAMFSGVGAAWLATTHDVPLWLCILAGICCTAAVSVLTEILVVRNIERRSDGVELQALVAVVAVLFVVEQFSGTVFGRDVLTLDPWIGGNLPLGSAVQISYQQLIVVLASVSVFAVVSLWLAKTRSGGLLRAVGSSPEAARKLGFPVKRIRLIAFAAAGAIAGLAGPLFAPQAGVSFTSGLSWAISGFLALVIGGTGRVWGPLVGALLLALCQVMVPYYLGSSSRDYVTFIIAAVFFILRPQGIFVRRVRT